MSIIEIIIINGSHSII